MRGRGTGVGIVGTGRALGGRVQDNEELCGTTLRGTTPEWILEKIGVQRRHLLAEGESASSLQLAAARGALAAAGVRPEQLGLIVVTTFSGEYRFPPCAARLHRDLGARGAQVFDLQANCAGFVTALGVAADRMRLDPELGYALVVGAEVLSRFVNPADPDTAPYFSDGAGAAVLGRVGEGRGLVSSASHTDTSNFEAVRLLDGTSAGERPWMEQNGLATWKQAVTHLPPVIRRACERGGAAPGDVDRLVLHQASLFLIRYVLQKLRLPPERAHVNVDRIGNTGAGSIPIALSEAVEQGAIRPGHKVVLAGVGAGFTFAASLWEWA